MLLICRWVRGAYRAPANTGPARIHRSSCCVIITTDRAHVSLGAVNRVINTMASRGDDARFRSSLLQIPAIELLGDGQSDIVDGGLAHCSSGVICLAAGASGETERYKMLMYALGYQSPTLRYPSHTTSANITRHNFPLGHRQQIRTVLCHFAG